MLLAQVRSLVPFTGFPQQPPRPSPLGSPSVCSLQLSLFLGLLSFSLSFSLLVAEGGCPSFLHFCHLPLWPRSGSDEMQKSASGAAAGVIAQGRGVGVGSAPTNSGSATSLGVLQSLSPWRSSSLAAPTARALAGPRQRKKRRWYLVLSGGEAGRSETGPQADGTPGLKAGRGIGRALRPCHWEAETRVPAKTRTCYLGRERGKGQAGEDNSAGPGRDRERACQGQSRGWGRGAGLGASGRPEEGFPAGRLTGAGEVGRGGPGHVRGRKTQSGRPHCLACG